MRALTYLLQCWFHQDWDLGGENAAEVVRTFCREERPKVILEALDDVQRLLDRDLPERELAAVVDATSHSYAPDGPQGHRGWMEVVERELARASGLRVATRHEEWLAERLASLPPARRARFAASCAEQIVALAQPHLRDPARDALAAVGRHVRGEAELGAAEADALAESLVAALPHEDESDVPMPQHAYDESAAAAVAYALQALHSESVDPAVWAARQPVDLIDADLGDLEDGDVFAHPRMLGELRRQRRELGAG